MKILLFPLILFMGLFVYAQDEVVKDDFIYKVTYKLEYAPDSTDTSHKLGETMFLYLGQEISRFSSAGVAVEDSILINRHNARKSKSNAAALLSQIPKTKFHYTIYKNIPENKISYVDKIVKDKFRYVESKTLFDWTIREERKQIAGYTAQKAETSYEGRNYVAWFTQEIAISDGPYKFNGLPGLILQISDTRDHYSFAVKQIKKIEDPVTLAFDPKDYIDSTKEKVEQLRIDYDRNPFAAFERVGAVIEVQPGERERMLQERREQLKKENNPIELKQ